MDDQARVRNITDLARLAGVSPGTVSRALADSSLIARKTRERIQALASEHEFRPNIMARNLRIKRAGAIAAVIPAGHRNDQHISDLCHMTLLGHLADALSDRGHDLLLLRADQTNPDWLHQIIGSGRVDGVILIGQSDQAEAIEKAASGYLSLVVWGAHNKDQLHCSVGSDSRMGGELAARHLVERGCRSFAFLGDPAAPEIAGRLAGVRAVLAEHEMENALTLLSAQSVDEPNNNPAVADWLNQSPNARRGLIADSDLTAMKAIRALSENGASVPSDALIVGYDDLPIARHSMPPLTSIRQDFAAGAVNLVDMLFRRIGGESTQSLMLEPRLMIRQST